MPDIMCKDLMAGIWPNIVSYSPQVICDFILLSGQKNSWKIWAGFLLNDIPKILNRPASLLHVYVVKQPMNVPSFMDAP
jgi:hypothetical protein